MAQERNVIGWNNATTRKTSGQFFLLRIYFPLYWPAPIQSSRVGENMMIQIETMAPTTYNTHKVISQSSPSWNSLPMTASSYLLSEPWVDLKVADCYLRFQNSKLIRFFFQIENEGRASIFYRIFVWIWIHLLFVELTQNSIQYRKFLYSIQY